MRIIEAYYTISSEIKSDLEVFTFTRDYNVLFIISVESTSVLQILLYTFIRR